jgi:hypothetical protein
VSSTCSSTAASSAVCRLPMLNKMKTTVSFNYSDTEKEYDGNNLPPSPVG